MGQNGQADEKGTFELEPRHVFYVAASLVDLKL